MLKQIKTLTKLQLMNLYGINVYRYSKDKNAKKKSRFMALMYVAVGFMLCTYIGGTVYGYAYMGMSDIIPTYLIMLCSVFALFFSIFKAGGVIFQKNSYEILCSLPLSQTAIVISRFLRMYVENLIISCLIMIVGGAVYGVLETPDISFYLIGFLVVLFVPLVPITIATLIGALITAISSRMRHKGIVSAGLSVGLFLLIILGTADMSQMEGSISEDMIYSLLETVRQVIESIYPPAVWMGDAMINGDYFTCILCVVVELVLYVIVILFVSANFRWINRGLHSTIARHDYQMESLKKNSVLKALYKKEMKRFFSSGVYVTNSIMGPIMSLVLSVTMLVIGIDTLQEKLGIPIDIKGFVPFVLAGILCIMVPSCVSISMEGKEWWIVKSLPIKTKDIIDSKILFSFSVILPFLMVSEVLLTIALRPSLMELVWQLAIPMVMVLFTCVFGVTVNLKFPLFTWENEVSVVKQSTSAFIGGIGGFVIVFICVIPMVLAPSEYSDIIKTAICVVFIGITAFLYKKNISVSMNDL